MKLNYNEDGTVCPYGMEYSRHNPIEIGSMACEKCQYFKSHNEAKQYVNCNYSEINLTKEL